jgi:hypothetical protein
MADSPRRDSHSFVVEKGRLPKNPVLADSGEGCGDSMTR